MKAMPNVTIIQGETFMKHCPVAGYPVEQIDWLMGKFGHLKSFEVVRKAFEVVNSLVVMHVIGKAFEVMEEKHFLKTPLFTEPQESISI